MKIDAPPSNWWNVAPYRREYLRSPQLARLLARFSASGLEASGWWLVASG